MQLQQTPPLLPPCQRCVRAGPGRTAGAQQGALHPAKLATRRLLGIVTSISSCNSAMQRASVASELKTKPNICMTHAIACLPTLQALPCAPDNDLPEAAGLTVKIAKAAAASDPTSVAAASAATESSSSSTDAAHGNVPDGAAAAAQPDAPSGRSTQQASVSSTRRELLHSKSAKAVLTIGASHEGHAAQPRSDPVSAGACWQCTGAR